MLPHDLQQHSPWQLTRWTGSCIDQQDNDICKVHLRPHVLSRPESCKPLQMQSNSSILFLSKNPSRVFFISHSQAPIHSMGNITTNSTSADVAEAVSSLGPAYGQYRERIMANGLSGSVIVSLSDPAALIDGLEVEPVHRMVILHKFDVLCKDVRKRGKLLFLCFALPNCYPSARTATAGTPPLQTTTQTHERNREAKALLEKFIVFSAALLQEHSMSTMRKLQQKGMLALIPDINGTCHSKDSGINGLRSLMIALRFGNHEPAKLLLQHPCIDVNCLDNGRRSSLLWACAWGYADVVQMIVQHPTFRKRAGEDCMALQLAAAVDQGLVGFLQAAGFRMSEDEDETTDDDEDA